MKRLFLLGVVCLMALAMQAVPRIAVLEFKAGVGVSQSDVDGISAMFITYFRPAGYTMVERTQIDKVIDEQGFQRSRMTERQMVRIGQILNVSKIVVGDVNVVMKQYNVDVRVINVESGAISATEGATFAGASYRTHMQSIAQKLAAKVAIKAGETVQPLTTQTTVSQYVDLGLPSGTLWKSSNEKGSLSEYDDAVSKFGGKLPTRVQWEELKGMCTWTWTGKGYKVTGENGNSIVLPAAGYYNGRSLDDAGSGGYYWSRTPNTYNTNTAYVLYFYSDQVYIKQHFRNCGASVRLVQD